MLDSSGRLWVRAEARRRGKDRVGRGGDMLLLVRTIRALEPSTDVV